MTQCANESNEQQLTLEMTDGYQLSYTAWHAENPEATIVLLNGIMSHSQWFRPISKGLNENNITVIGADRRGSGPNSQSRGDAPSRQQLVSDVLQIIKAHKINNQPLYLLGWCWGAALAINVVLESHENINGLALLAPGIYASNEIASRVKNQQAKLLKSPHSLDDPCLDNPVSEEMFTDSSWLDDYILKDDLRLKALTPRLFGIMLKMSANASLHLSDINCPLLLITANKDKTVDNEKTLIEFGKIGARSLRMHSCQSQHGMQFEVPDKLTSYLCSWMKDLQEVAQ